MSEMVFPDEERFLTQMMVKLNTAVAEADANVAEIDKDYREAKRYMAENRGDIDPHEMFQNELALKRIDHIGAFAAGSRERLLKLQDSPYFARIDFQAEDDEAPESYYIGRFSFNFRNALLIFDWRAPISNMFYNCELGSAGYQAPAGWIAGELTRKRQFKIKAGKLDYVIESSVNIQDDVLQRELSQTSDDRMKSIIGTIQKEQNEIIRDEQANTIIIQGVAGSGKTSVALHRVAYLLYRFKDRLSSHNVMILSPNKVFGDYISSVLPELGEEPIYEWSIGDIAEVQTEGFVAFEPAQLPVYVMEPANAKSERASAGPISPGKMNKLPGTKQAVISKRNGWAERAKLKSTAVFLEKLEQYSKTLSQHLFQPADYHYGRFTVDRDWIQKRFDAYDKYPIKRRLQMVADDISDRLETDNIMEDELPKTAEICRTLISMLKVKSTLELYQNFYKQNDMPDMLVMPGRRTLEWADVYPYLYIHAAFEGIKVSHMIKHLVIDEMQDYTPVQYAVLNQIFPCQKTILGDFGQFIHPYHRHKLADIAALYPEGRLIYLNKSYRSSYEIIVFAGRIKNAGRLEAIERHGEEPQIHGCRDKQQELAMLVQRINEFSAAAGNSLGIIAKTEQAAAEWYGYFADSPEVHLISSESTGFQPGASIVSVPMAKGLEFDEVIIIDADSDNYATEYDSRLLYVAVTRAMHRLLLLHTGELTKLII